MKKYFFVFGRDEELSFIELMSYFDLKKINFKINENFGNVLIVSLPQLNFSKTIKDLGGVVKIGEIIDDFSSLYSGNKNKIRYGVSVYGGKKNIRNDLKNYFKNEGLKAFFKKPKRDDILSPSEIIKGDVIEILVHGDYLAKTIAVFDPFEYEKRDLGRPKKDFVRMSSIRLSKILVNLSQTKKKLLDPFCGYGTILQEGLLNGFSVVGCDKDSEAIKCCEKNLDWLKKRFTVKDYKLFNCDVKDLSKYVRGVDGIATEPYLGPYLKKKPTIEQAKKWIDDLTGLYSYFLKELSKILHDGGKVAIIVPRFRTFNNKLVKMAFSRLVEENKFKICKFDGVKMPIIYLHKILEREIWVLEK